MVDCSRRDVSCVLYERHGPRVCESRGCEYSPIKVEGKGSRGCCPYYGKGALMCSNNKCPEIRGSIAYVE